MDTDEILLETESGMEQALGHMFQEFASIRTGKASPALVENLLIDAYGTTMKLKELAVIGAPEPRMLLIQPFDASNVKPIEKAIKESRLGINPVSDGKILRLPIPELSEERRVELVKQVKIIAEEARVSMRSHRRQSLDTFKKMQKESAITEDDLRRLDGAVQELTDSYVKKIDEHLKSKSGDIMQI